MNTAQYGPPTAGPIVRIMATGLDVVIQVNDDLDAEIVAMALAMAERRRWAKQEPAQ